MPTALTRLFDRGRPRKGADGGYGLRLVAGILAGEQPLRGVDAACRLAMRSGVCDLAAMFAFSRDDGGLHLERLSGRLRKNHWRDLLEAFTGRHSPLANLGEQPLWIQLGADPFQPGAPALRRFDFRWLLALPTALPDDESNRSGVVVLAGRDPDVDEQHRLVRDAGFIWQAVRTSLVRPNNTHDTNPQTQSVAESWFNAPAPLVALRGDGVMEANPAAEALLDGNVGRAGQGWQPWLLGAVQRLDAAGIDSEVLSASRSRERSLEVTLGRTLDDGQTRLVALHAVDETVADTVDQEATLRTLGHELRTPLSAMSTSLDLVLRGDTGPLTADQTRFLGATKRNLERLNRLLGDLLDAKRAEAGYLAITTETVDLGELLHEDLLMFDVTTREKGIALDFEGVPRSFRACVDADKVQQMVHNVVSNAVKFTPRNGMVRIWLQDRTERAPGLGVRLARRFQLALDVFTLVVEDSGMGMSEEYLQHLFQPFNRDGRVEAQQLPGVGLGLHITRGLVEAHGGEIRVSSQPGQGTTVWLVMPREPESGRVLTAGRQLDTLRTTAIEQGHDAALVALDLRHLRGQIQPGELEQASRTVTRFLADLAGTTTGRSRQLCHALMPGLWVGLAQEISRLDPAWQVAVSAPECPDLLAGSRWETLDTIDSTVPATLATTLRTPAG